MLNPGIFPLKVARIGTKRRKNVSHELHEFHEKYEFGPIRAKRLAEIRKRPKLGIILHAQAMILKEQSMDPICKTITRNPTDRREGLVWATRDTRWIFLSFLAFPLIVGLEFYYQNHCGDPGTLYLCGFGTWVYGGTLVLLLLFRRAESIPFRNFFLDRGWNIEEMVWFTEDAFEVKIAGYASYRYSWLSLTSFRDTRHTLQFTLGGNLWLIAKKHFTQDELAQIVALLRQKQFRPQGQLSSPQM